jgi:hypothetical protein
MENTDQFSKDEKLIEEKSIITQDFILFYFIFMTLPFFPSHLPFSKNPIKKIKKSNTTLS